VPVRKKEHRVVRCKEGERRMNKESHKRHPWASPADRFKRAKGGVGNCPGDRAARKRGRASKEDTLTRRQLVVFQKWNFSNVW